MKLPLPAQESDTVRAWTIGDHAVCVTPDRGLFSVQANWANEPQRSVGVPTVGLRTGDTQAVAHLVQPLTLGGKERTSGWISWPLEVAIYDADGGLIDAHRPGGRRTLLGPIEAGVVLPAMQCSELSGPLAERAPHIAALAFSVVNLGTTPVILRRFPVVEAMLDGATQDGVLVLGTVEVAVHDEGRAAANVTSLTLPSGFTSLPKDERRVAAASFNWLLDATRRSSGFQI